MSYKKFSNEEDRYQFLKHSSDLHKDTAENDPITVTPIVTGQETSHTLNLPRPGKYVRKPLFSCDSNYLQWCIPSLLTPAASLGSAFMMHRIAKRLAFSKSPMLFMAPALVVLVLCHILFFVLYTTGHTSPVGVALALLLLLPLWFYQKIRLFLIRKKYISRFPLETVAGRCIQSTRVLCFRFACHFAAQA